MKNIILIIMVVMLFLNSCGIKPSGWLKEGIVAVMADPDDWALLEQPLKRIFERTIRTPQDEKKITLQFVTPEEFERYTLYQHLVLVGTLESEGRIGKLINGVVANPAVREFVENGEHFMFTQENQWARDQSMIILVSKDVDMLKRNISDYEEIVYSEMDNNINEHIKDLMYDQGEQTDLADRLMSYYNWSLRIPGGYFIAQEFPLDGFIWFRKMFPERWIFVRWIDGADTAQLNQEWIISERNRIGSEYYGGDRISDKYLYSWDASFLGRKAVITRGLWENDTHIKGGPFINYTFYDAYTQQLYMIDFAIHAPAQDKMPFIRRHDIIAATFKTVFD